MPYPSKRTTIYCEFCGKPRSVMLSKASTTKTCGSKECGDASRRRNGLRNFAGRQHSEESKQLVREKKLGPQIEVECACGCGTRFLLPAYRIRASKTGRFYVDSAHTHLHLRGENHPCWRGGGFNYDWAWRKIAKEVRERDQVCQHCGKTPEENGRALDVHHIRPFREVGIHDPENLIALCSVCHGAQQTAEQIVYPTEKKETCTECGIVFCPPKPCVRVCGEECQRTRRKRWERESAQRARDEGRPSAERHRIYVREWQRKRRQATHDTGA